jgi:hypothetical protein
VPVQLPRDPVRPAPRAPGSRSPRVTVSVQDSDAVERDRPRGAAPSRQEVGWGIPAHARVATEDCRETGSSSRGSERKLSG